MERRHARLQPPTLINVFIWMLWGDLLPLPDGCRRRQQPDPPSTQEIHASNTLIAIAKTSLDRTVNRGAVPHRLNMVRPPSIAPGPSNPFMLYATPPLALFIPRRPFATRSHANSNQSPPIFSTAIPSPAFTIALLTVSYAGYKFCDIFPQSGLLLPLGRCHSSAGHGHIHLPFPRLLHPRRSGLQ